jgi:8-oxo-dGTP diphosphatase
MASVEKVPHIGDVVCAIIEKDGLFLVAQRPEGKSMASLWEFPGGKVNQNEPEEAALQRELQEELGVTVKIIQRLTPCFHRYEDFSLTLIPYRCLLHEEEPLALEHQELRWISPYEIGLYNFPDADLPILEEYLAHHDDYGERTGLTAPADGFQPMRTESMESAPPSIPSTGKLTCSCSLRKPSI